MKKGKVILGKSEAGKVPDVFIRPIKEPGTVDPDFIVFNGSAIDAEDCPIDSPVIQYLVEELRNSKVADLLRGCPLVVRNDRDYLA